MYAADGMIVLDLDDLITWVQERYITEAREKLREEARQRKQDKKSHGEGTGVYPFEEEPFKRLVYMYINYVFVICSFFFFSRNC